jgi:hypothetical protein
VPLQDSTVGVEWGQLAPLATSRAVRVEVGEYQALRCLGLVASRGASGQVVAIVANSIALSSSALPDGRGRSDPLPASSATPAPAESAAAPSAESAAAPSAESAAAPAIEAPVAGAAEAAGVIGTAEAPVIGATRVTIAARTTWAPIRVGRIAAAIGTRGIAAAIGACGAAAAIRAYGAAAAIRACGAAAAIRAYGIAAAIRAYGIAAAIRAYRIAGAIAEGCTWAAAERCGQCASTAVGAPAVSGSVEPAIPRKPQWPSDAEIRIRSPAPDPGSRKPGPSVVGIVGIGVRLDIFRAALVRVLGTIGEPDPPILTRVDPLPGGRRCLGFGNDRLRRRLRLCGQRLRRRRR